MNNTAFLFGALAVAFLIYVTAKGDLPKWLGLFGLAGSGTSPSPGTGQGAAGSGPSPAAPYAIPPLPAIPPIGGSGTATLVPGL